MMMMGLHILIHIERDDIWSRRCGGKITWRRSV